MELLLGNCLDRLKDLEDNSVDAIVTDPPYGLSFMGKKWDYDVPSVDIWKECLRVLKPGGYLLSFAGTRTQHRMAVNIEDAGFEIRDMIAWVYGSGFPKSLNIGKAVDKLQGKEREIVGKMPVGYSGLKRNANLTDDNWKGITAKDTGLEITKGTSQWEGWGTALKPALEPITVARKPLSEKSVAENCLKWGVGGINIDGCRVGYTDGTTEKQIRRKYTGNNEGNNSVTNNFGVKEIKMTSESTLTGRFPANLIHDGSDEVVEGFPNTVSKWGKSKRRSREGGFVGFAHNAIQDDKFIGDSGSASRFFYCAKASKRERNKGLENMEKKAITNAKGNGLGRVCNICGANQLNPCNCKNNTWILPKKNQNNHPTVKPIALMEYLVKLVSREGQVVLDPFMGSGTTGMACKKLDRDFIGIEMMPEYMEIAKARIDGVKKEDQLNMI